MKACRPASWCMVVFSKWTDANCESIHSELSNVVTLNLESSQFQTVSFLGRTLTLRQWTIVYEPDQQHVSRALKVLGLTDACGVATPGTDDAGDLKASDVSELHRTAKWREPPERKMIFSLEKT